MKTQLFSAAAIACAALGFAAPHAAAAIDLPEKINGINIDLNGTKATYPDDLGPLPLRLKKEDLADSPFRFVKTGDNTANLVFTDWDDYTGKFALTFQTPTSGTYHKTYTGPFTGFVSGTFTILRIDSAERPEAKGRQLTVEAGKSVRFKLKGEKQDIGGKPLKFIITDKPKTGTLNTKKLPNVVYKAKKGFIGTVKFKFVVKEGKTKSKPATVTIKIR